MTNKYAAADEDEFSEGFSCTYMNKKVDSMLNELVVFVDYNPEYALEVVTNLSEKVERARRYIEAVALDR